MSAWEEQFRRWSNPSSDSEAERQANAQRMIADAIRNHPVLQAHTINVIVQGSYRNNTNVRQDSDVDICVCCMDTFFYEFHFADYGKAEANVTDALYSYAQFKCDVQAALVAKFGARSVTRGRKAFDVRENTYRVEADVVPAFAYRMYTKRVFDPVLLLPTTRFIEPPGTKFYPDTGTEVVNWPEQQYANEVAKNQRTARRYKSVVRALKNLALDMATANVAGAKSIPSFLIESLAYNVPDPLFGGDSYENNVRDTLISCFNATNDDASCSKWVEPNNIKLLFHGSQPWTRQQVNAFTVAAWQYCGFR